MASGWAWNFTVTRGLPCVSTAGTGTTSLAAHITTTSDTITFDGDVSITDAADYVFGFGVGLDMTCRDRQKEAKKLAQLTDDEEAQALYVRTFLDLYQRAAAPQAEDTVSRVSVSDLACLALATAPVRGLERHIFPGLVHDQKLVKQSVLKAQDKIPHSIERHIRARILASASAMLSRQARHLARTMAHADSIVALSIYRRTFLPQTSSSSSSSSKHKKAPK